MTVMTSVRSMVLRPMTGVAPAVATCGAMLSGCVALSGYGLLLFLFMTRYYAPASHHYVRPLHFDYSGSVAEAVAPLSPNLREQVAIDKSTALTGGAAALIPKSRFLPTGSQVAVHVCLVIPWDHTDLFQVTGELLTNTSRVAARSSRTYINTHQPFAYRLAKQLLFLPLHVLGWGHGDWVHVDLPLFDGYEEREDAPVSVFRARLTSRSGAIPPPPVHKAEVHVRLKMGFFQTALFWLRPGLLTSVVLLLVGLSTAGMGTTGALGLAVLACMLLRWARKSEEQARKMRSGALPLGAPSPGVKRGKGGQPFGTLEDAMSYSLAHARFFPEAREGREGRRRGSLVTEEEEDMDAGGGDGGLYKRHLHGGFGGGGGGGFNQRRQHDGADDATSYNMHGGGPLYGHDSPPAWSGSSAGPCPSGDGPGTGSHAGGPPSRQSSGAPPQPAPHRWHSAGKAVAGERTRSGEAVGYRVDEQYDDDGTAGGSDVQHDDGLEETGWEQPVQGAQDGGDAEDSEAVEGEEEGGEEEPVGNSGKAGADAGEPRDSDLDPQADNASAAGAFRKRTGYTWKA